ncbi:unnamed protein product, partial [Ilex paraguariensis]
MKPLVFTHYHFGDKEITPIKSYRLSPDLKLRTDERTKRFANRLRKVRKPPGAKYFYPKPNLKSTRATIGILLWFAHSPTSIGLFRAISKLSPDSLQCCTDYRTKLSADGLQTVWFARLYAALK